MRTRRTDRKAAGTAHLPNPLDGSFRGCGNIAMSEDQRWLSELSARWWEYRRLSQGDRSQRKALAAGEPAAVCAAADIVSDRIHAGGVDAIRLVVALIDTA